MSEVGYRFHPTDEELLDHFLRNKILGESSVVEKTVREIDVYSFDPPQLPEQSKIKSTEPQWYFFCPRDNPNGKRTKRTTSSGNWRISGRDRKIRKKRGNHEIIGKKKTLLFYKGRGREAELTDWVMHEYHLTSIPDNLKAFVVCKIKNKQVTAEPGDSDSIDIAPIDVGSEVDQTSNPNANPNPNPNMQQPTEPGTTDQLVVQQPTEPTIGGEISLEDRDQIWDGLVPLDTEFNVDHSNYPSCSLNPNDRQVPNESVSHSRTEPGHSDSNDIAPIDTGPKVDQTIEETPEDLSDPYDFEALLDYFTDHNPNLQFLKPMNIGSEVDHTSNPNPNVQQPTYLTTEGDQPILNESGDQLVNDLAAINTRFEMDQRIQETPEFWSDPPVLNESEDLDQFVNDHIIVDPYEMPCETSSLHEHCNDYRPPESLTGVCSCCDSDSDYSSDSDAETSYSMSHQETSSPVDSSESSSQIHAYASCGPDFLDDGRSPRTEESPVSTKASKSRYQPKNVNNVGQEYPIRLQRQDRVARVSAPKAKVTEVAPLRSEVELSKKKNMFNPESEKERKMAHETNKKTSMSNGKEEGCFIILQKIEISHKPNLLSLLNVIVRLILFVSILRQIQFVH